MVSVGAWAIHSTMDCPKTGGQAVARCDLEHLFGKADARGAPSRGRRVRSGLSERGARRIITIVAVLSLLLLAAGIFLHFRDTHRHNAKVQRQQFVSLLRLAAHGLSEAVRGADTVRAPLAEDIRHVVPGFAFGHGRHFIIVDEAGKVQAFAGDGAPPAWLPRAGAPLPAALRRLVMAADGTAEVERVVLANGEELLAGAMPLRTWPGAVVLTQQADTTASSSDNTATMLLLLFAGVFVVMAGLTAIYNWQSRWTEEENCRHVDFIRRLEASLQLGRCGLWDWDISRGRIYLSPSMRQLLNLPGSEGYMGYMDLKDFLALQHPEEPPIDQLLEEGLSKGQQTFEHELRLRRAQDGWAWVKMRGALPEEQSDQGLHLVGIAVDITEQKLANDAARDAEQRLTQAIEAISESFALWDERMRMVTCNSKFREFFGLSAEACESGRTLAEVMRDAANPVRKRHAPRTLGDGAQQETIAELELADGRWLQISERPMPGGGLVSVGTDITELKRKQIELENSRRELERTVEALERSQREIRHKNEHLNMLARRFRREKERAEDALRIKSQFLANVSHELFTPLNHIIGSADAMRNEVLGELSTIYRDYAERIHASGQEISRKIHDMLEYAQLSTEYDNAEPRKTDIAGLVADVGERFMAEAERKNILLSWRAPQNLESVLDVDLVHKALMQLVSNAVRFTSRGEVRISAGLSENGELTFEVRDTGIGIPAEKIARIGQPFERAGEAYNSHSGGSGIGLAIAKAVAEKHGGRLEIDSREGAGTQVRLVVPHVTPARAQDSSGEKRQEPKTEASLQPQLFDDE